jgi:hypothetical protein
MDMIEWAIILYINGVGAVGSGASFYTKAECESAAVAWVKPDVRPYCLAQYVRPISVLPPHDGKTKPAAPGSTCTGMTAEECFYFGVAAGEGLPE